MQQQLVARTTPLASPQPNPTRLQVTAVERDAKVPLYQGTPEDIHLAVVSAGSSHSASISRRCAGMGQGQGCGLGPAAASQGMHLCTACCFWHIFPLLTACPPPSLITQRRAVHLGPGQQRGARTWRLDSHRGRRPSHDHQPAAHTHRQRGLRRQPHAGHQ